MLRNPRSLILNSQSLFSSFCCLVLNRIAIHLYDVHRAKKSPFLILSRSQAQNNSIFSFAAPLTSVLATISTFIHQSVLPNLYSLFVNSPLAQGSKKQQLRARIEKKYPSQNDRLYFIYSYYQQYRLFKYFVAI